MPDLCPIERTTIAVAGDAKVAISGGACPKFEVVDQDAAKLEREAPNPFERRAALIASFVQEIPGARVLAIPQNRRHLRTHSVVGDARQPARVLRPPTAVRHVFAGARRAAV